MLNLLCKASLLHFLSIIVGAGAKRQRCFLISATTMLCEKLFTLPLLLLAATKPWLIATNLMGHTQPYYWTYSAILWDILSHTMGHIQPYYGTCSAILWDILSHIVGQTQPYYRTYSAWLPELVVLSVSNVMTVQSRDGPRHRQFLDKSDISCILKHIESYT